MAPGNARDFNPKEAIDPAQLFAFIEATQAALWESLRKQHGVGLEAGVLDALLKTLDSQGTLEVVRHGFKFYGKRIDVAYFRPSHGLNPDVVALYEQNRLVVTRQVKFNPSTDQSVDMVLSLNGLPIATVELKNHLTGQSFSHAIQQYRDRDQHQKVFQFKKRALVHFAVDSDEAHMTTRLSGHQTRFLPFNRGYQGGAGNGPHESGYRTGYLWEDTSRAWSSGSISTRRSSPRHSNRAPRSSSRRSRSSRS